METDDDIGLAKVMRSKGAKHPKLPDATYIFADGSKVRGRTDESVDQIKARYNQWYGGIPPAVVDEIRDPDRRGREDED